MHCWGSDKTDDACLLLAPSGSNLSIHQLVSSPLCIATVLFLRTQARFSDINVKRSEKKPSSMRKIE